MKGDSEYPSQVNHGNSCQVLFQCESLSVLESFDFVKINDFDVVEMNLLRESQEERGYTRVQGTL